MDGKIEIVDDFNVQPHTCRCEAGGGRCDICFGPIEKTYLHEQPLPENVVPLDIVTSNNIDPTTVLRIAADAKIADLCIVGVTEEGREFFASSMSDAAEAIYYLQRGIHKLNRIVDECDMGDGNIERKP